MASSGVVRNGKDNSSGMVLSLKYPCLTESNNKQALTSARSELRLLVASKTGKYSVRYLRASLELWDSRKNKPLTVVKSIGRRLYLLGEMYDITADVMSSLILNYGQVKVPPCKKGVRLNNREEGDDVLITSLERFTSRQSGVRKGFDPIVIDQLEVADYILKVYNKEVVYNELEYRRLVRDSPKVSAGWEIIYEDYARFGVYDLRLVRFSDVESRDIPDSSQGERGSTETVGISESRDIPTLPLVSNRGSDTVGISESRDIPNSESGVDMELLFNLVKENNDMLKTLIQVLPSIATLPEIKAILSHKPQIREVVVQEDSKLKNRTLDIESEGCNEFMVAVLSRYAECRLNGLSQLKSAEAVVDEIETNPRLAKYHLPFIVANRGRKNGSSSDDVYLVEAINVKAWAEKTYIVKDGRAVKRG